jgi:fumarate reductase flavoprotein subunit
VAVERYDLVVVGGGLAGWTAAVRAQELGCTVALVERDGRRPGWGNSVVSGGVLHAVLRDPRDPPDDLLATIEELTDGHTDPEVARAWADNCAPTVAWMEAHGAPLATDPDIPMRARMFEPVRPTVPGLIADGYGTQVYLSALADGFEASGGVLRQPARAVGLRRTEDGWEVALDLGDGAGDAVAARAVVLCDGGFQADPELLRRYVGTDAVRVRAADTATGDGLRMGLAAGGVPVEMAGFYGHLLSRQALERDDLWPYPIFDLLAAVGVVVGPDAKRLVDEAHSGVTTSNAIAWSAHPDGAWLVIDDAAWEEVGRIGVTPPNPWLDDHGGTRLSAGDVVTLAGLAGIDPDGLSATVDAVTTAPAAAVPPRSGTVRLSVPPFHAIALSVGVTFTLGGLRVDGSARVLDADGKPIPGLYAAGGTMGGLHGGPRAGYAGGLLEACVFGLLAGTDAPRLAG